MIRHILYVNLLAISLISCARAPVQKDGTNAAANCTLSLKDALVQKYSENRASANYTSNITSYKDFKTAYFDNLTTNYGVNYKNSCGYVAMGQLLSYYDTYWDDNIIDEKYDITSNGDSKNIIERRNSPGTFKDEIVDANDPTNISYPYELTPSQYYAIVKANKEKSFHSYLISLGAELGYYDFNNESSPCGTTFTQRKNILTKYLNSRGLKYTINSYNGESSESLSNNVRQFAIAEIKKGNPVLLSIKSPLGGHAVVAYDYDSSSDSIYCHLGWGSSVTHVTPESVNYTRYKSALSLTFEGEHSHSNNYTVTTSSGDATTISNYCFDTSEACIYKHDHTHNYLNYSATYHKAFCACGQYELKPHQIDRTSEFKKGVYTYALCIDCKRLINTTTDSGMLAYISLEEEEF